MKRFLVENVTILVVYYEEDQNKGRDKEDDKLPVMLDFFGKFLQKVKKNLYLFF